MKPSPRYSMNTKTDTIAAQARTIKEQRKELDRLRQAIQTMNRHADGIAAARKELISLLTGNK